ncbi:hypothetical protein [Teredinibacter turnerae]|uniref:hypothetical protein n=1 Tax=Teredinibacter turnerae TaxID=2426 RepID=UPI00036CD809|nr:hypothetical protein [Teredinibacter turnerae]
MIEKTAEEIAQLVIDKSYWGNEWFLVFTLLVFFLLSSGAAMIGAYLSTRGRNAAMRADFNAKLDNIKTETEAIKIVQEKIENEFTLKHELLKVKREKLEEIYMALHSEHDELSYNLIGATAEDGRKYVYPSNRSQMLSYLHFPEELRKEMDAYTKSKNLISSRILELTKMQGTDNGCSNIQEKVKESNDVFDQFKVAKSNVEMKLEEVMKNLTKLSN